MTHLYNLPEPLEVELVTHTKTVTIPSKARWLYIVAYGGAGGGGGGASGAIDTQRGGGAGGQAGLMNFAMVPTLMFPQSRLTVYPGAGGAGGGPGTAGQGGGSTVVRLWDASTFILNLFAGQGGNPGTSTAGGTVSNTGTGGNNFGYNFTGDGGLPANRTGTNGGSTGNSNSLFYNSVELGGTGGTGGAGCPAGSYAVANAGSIQYTDFMTIGGGGGNATAGGNGVNGDYVQLPITNYNGLVRAWGGTGGGNSNSGPGGNGGNGGLASGGGGGGGGLTGGSGGRGGDGYAIVCWW